MKKLTLLLLFFISIMMLASCVTNEDAIPNEDPIIDDDHDDSIIDDDNDDNDNDDNDNDDNDNDDDDLSDEDEFISNLLNSLTLEEKIGQMLQAEINYITLEEVSEYNIGSILSGGGSHPTNFDDDVDTWFNMVYSFQEAALNSSSEIPLLFGIDAVHGHNNVYGATIFPHNINLGMTQNKELLREIGEATAQEVKATGIHWNFSPAVSVAEDIRWGRTYESFSENPSIQLLLTKAYIEGLQAHDVVATAKHYVADGGTLNGIDQGDALLSEAYIREVHLSPYIEAIDAGVESIMISFSSINGEKMHGNDYWINDVLKDELGFEGIILSDWNATFQLPGDYRTQLVSAINAGVDVLMLPMDWKSAHQEILFAVNNGSITQARINEAVSRILRVKYRNNLFTEPFDRLNPEDHFATEEHQLLARQAASESFVLLKNNDVFPLVNSDNIYITGPASDHVGYLSGGWTTYWQGNTEKNIGTGMSIKEALQERLHNTSGSLVNSVDEADTVIIVFTEIPYAEGAGDTMNPSIFGDKAHPDNYVAYQKAIEAKNQGKTVIGVLASGRPLILEDTLDTFDAFIAIFLPGSEGGSALVNTMYGEHPFSGKLSFTWPKSINYFTNKDESNILFSFGYGLEVDAVE
ncbi:MAG: glycoside hydrolase family 3 protein [Candidatus Izemoplasmataceae bacterium]